MKARVTIDASGVTVTLTPESKFEQGVCGVLENGPCIAVADLRIVEGRWIVGDHLRELVLRVQPETQAVEP